MSTRRSKKNIAPESESDKEAGHKKENTDQSSDEDESGKYVENPQESSPKETTGRRLLRSQGKNTGKEDNKNISKVDTQEASPDDRKSTSKDDNKKTSKDNKDKPEQEESEVEKTDEETLVKATPPRKRKRDVLDPIPAVEGKRKPKKNPRFFPNSDDEDDAKDLEDIEVSDEEDDYVVENEDEDDDDDEDYDIEEETTKGKKTYTGKRKASNKEEESQPNKKSRKSDAKLNLEEDNSSESSSEKDHFKNVANIKQYTKKGTGTVTVKKIIPGASKGEIELVSYEENNSEKPNSENKETLSPDKLLQTFYPTKKLGSITKADGRKYMILDKATIKGMMEKGIIQTIDKDGNTPQNVSYKAMLPKSSRPSILRRVPVAGVGLKSQQSKADSTSGTVPVKIVPNSTRNLTTESGVKVQIPTSNTMQVTGLGGKQVLSSPVYVKNPVAGGSNMQVVSIPASILNQIQKGGSVFSLSNTSTGDKTTTTTATNATSKGTVLVSSDLKPVSMESDLDNPDPVENESESGDDEKNKTEDYGTPTGVCKVLKSMKMFQYVGSESSSKNSSKHVRWVAVPNKAEDLKSAAESGKLQRCAAPVLPIHNPPGGLTSKESPELQKSKKGLRRILKEMKVQHRRLIGKHRTRYSRLQKKFNELERDFQEVEDVGTPQQIVRDCKKFLSAEHALFMESQMFWKNTEGKGNRYNKRFLILMLDLYHKSPAGYKYLKTVFTLPSIKTLLKLESKGIRSENSVLEKNSVNGNALEEVQGDGSLRTVGDTTSDFNHELPVLNIKKEALTVTKEDSMSLPVDSKDWFKSGMMLSESVPSTSGETVFMSSSQKEAVAGGKTEHDIEVEEEHVNPPEDPQSITVELSEEGPSMPTLDALSKKVVVVPDNDSISKQEITIQWDESWGGL